MGLRQQAVRGPGWLTLGLVLLVLWELTWPMDFAPEAVSAWLGDRHIGKLNTAANLVLFWPVGLVGAWWAWRIVPGRAWVVGVVTFCAAAVSLVGETVQVWMPDRHSSVVDLVANTLGAGVGAMMGWLWAARMTAVWVDLGGWLGARRRAKWALIVAATVIVARTWPFDISPETFYLRWSLVDSVKAGWPLSKTMAWYSHPVERGVAWGQVVGEWARLVGDGGLFAALAWAMCGAMRQIPGPRGVRTTARGMVLVIGAGLVLGTELLQWPIRSRLMDLTGAVGGLVGVVGGIVCDWVTERLRPRAG